MQATADQYEAAKRIKDFLNDPESQVFRLTGYAGTGKTYLMAEMVQFLHYVERPFVLMAPTGRAALVAGQASGDSASTLHSVLYRLDKMEDRNTRFKLHFSTRQNEDAEDTVYIVDEASMISNTVPGDSELVFGSGKLLEDLLAYVGVTGMFVRPKAKLILIGDPAQLNPVGMGFSPALDTEYLGRYFDTSVQVAHLSELVRQGVDSGIARNSQRIRESMFQPAGKPLRLDAHYQDVELLSMGQFGKVYFNGNLSVPPESTMIVVHSNKQMSAYNEYIRHHIFPGKPTVQPGDQLMITRNNYSYEADVYNGQFATVEAVKEEAEVKNITFKGYKGAQASEKLYFREATLQVRKLDGSPFSFKALLLENTLYSKSGKVPFTVQQALYIDFKNRHSDYPPGSDVFLQAMMADRYFNAIQAQFGYAVTCHKAQGGEWDRVFVDFKTYFRGKPQEFYRWAYTGVTRAKRQLFGINVMGK